MTDGSVDDAAVLNALFANSPQGLFILDAERRVSRYNTSGRGVRGLDPEDIIGHSVDDFAPGFDPAVLDALIDEAWSSGQPLRGRLVRGEAPSEPGRTVTAQLSLFPLESAGEGPPPLLCVVEDVTESQAAADRLAVLASVHANVGTTLDTRSTAEELVRALAPAFADAAAVDLLENADVAAQRAGTSATGAPLRRTAFAPSSARRIWRDKESRVFPFATPYAQALNDRRARLLTVTPDTPWLSVAPDDFALLVRVGVHSMIVAPLTVRDTLLGLLTLYRHRSDPFSEADLGIAVQAASAASAHLDNARSYHREHTVATTLHRWLQPTATPDLSAVETANVYLPETAGGDWFDVIPLSGTRVGLVVGDVVGQGIEAAATMGQLRTALRSLALQDLETDEMLSHLYEVAAQMAGEGAPVANSHLATCALTVYDPLSRQCSMVRAGHPAPLLVDPHGFKLEVDVPEGPSLGPGGGHAFAPVEIEVEPGTVLAHYTNGLLDAGGPDRETAARRLTDVLASSNGPLRELCDTAVYRMAPSHDDDAVLLLARTRAMPRDRIADWTLPADASVVGTARRLVDRQLAAWHLEEFAFTTGLVVSELFTNAIRYGSEPLRLRLIRDQNRLLSEVTDANSASPHMRRARESDEGGRGLFVVMRLSTRWGVRHNRQDKTIWSEQRLDGPPPDLTATDTVFDLDDVPEL
ncbi:SpoIIE family protein phosphatase [Streptomyces fragilis]|uniref:SpoIIE family protein phosphatase n=1 Tax=Streptomyces fragilis TaxID=67301 RepID=A0ABV2YFD5_9ACTN|nr:SpoIIE family protein phosphatase [Streptomyces fragilis]